MTQNDKNKKIKEASEPVAFTDDDIDSSAAKAELKKEVQSVAGDQAGQPRKKRRRRRPKKKVTDKPAEITDVPDVSPEPIVEPKPFGSPEPFVEQPVEPEPVQPEPVAESPFAAPVEPAVPAPEVSQEPISFAAPVVESPFSAPREPAAPELEPAPFVAPEPVVQPESVVQPEPIVQPEPVAESPFSAPAPGPVPVQPVTPPMGYEDRYQQEEHIQQPGPSVSAESPFGEQSQPGPVDPEPVSDIFGDPQPSPAGINPEERANFDPQSSPFSSGGTPDMTEDVEKNENTDNASDDNIFKSNDPAHHDINFGDGEEGATSQFEKNDPLVTGAPSNPFGAEPGFESEAEPIAEPISEFEPKVEVAEVVSSPVGLPGAIPGGLPGAEAFPENDDEGGFMAMLEEAGITKRSIFIVLGAILGVVFIVLTLIFGWYRVVTDLFVSDGTEPQQAVEVTEPEEDLEEEDEEDPLEVPDPPVVSELSKDQLFAISGIVNSYIFGLEFSDQRTLDTVDLTPVAEDGSLKGIESALILGQSAYVSKTNYEYYVSHLQKINNAVSLDVYEYLSREVDRRASLEGYVSTLNSLLMEAEAISNVISQEMTRIEAEYDATSEEKQKYENGYFDTVESLHGGQSFNYLELFVEASQKLTKQKAFFNALQTLQEKYSVGLSILEPRIQDLSLNSEALIKGVRVFEVPNSNIDAIILDQGL